MTSAETSTATPSQGRLDFEPAAALRMAFVVVGGLLVLVSNTNHLTATKVGYFAGVALALLSILRRRELWADLGRRATTIRTLAPLTLALGALIVISLPVAHAEHTGLSPWLRDAATYGLVAAVPLFIWDFERNASPRLGQLAIALLALGGVLSGLSLIVQWLGTRNVTSSRISLHILPGQFLPGALALFLAARAGSASRGRGWYALGALAIPLALILTGTRSLISLLVCVAIVLASRWQNKRALLLWSGAAIVAVTLIVAALVALGHRGHPGLARLSHRITSIPHTVAHPNSDASYRLRANEWHVAWETFKAHPLVGVGPGHTFTWNCKSSGCPAGTQSRYDIDSPLTFPAKFGVLGLVGLAFVVFGLMDFLRARRQTAPHDAWLAFAWYLVFAVAELPFGWPLEQKDFGLGLLLLGALVVQPEFPSFAQLAGSWASFRRRPSTEKESPHTHLERDTIWTVKGGTTGAIVALAGAAAAAIGFALAGWHRPAARAGGGTAPLRTKVLPPPAVFRAAAEADAHVWGYWHCGGTCQFAVKPLSTPATSLWELQVHNAGATSCFLLDTDRFNRAKAASVRLPDMRC